MSKRPGTVDYSKFDNLDFSDDSEDEREREEREERYRIQDEQDRRKAKRLREERNGDSDDGVSYDESSGEYDDESEESEKSYDDDDEESYDEESSVFYNPQPPRPRPRPAARVPEASLATLQHAWGAKVDDKGNVKEEAPTAATTGSSDGNGKDNGDNNDKDTGNTERTCASCLRPSPPYRCSRCKMVWFCNVRCQTAYHPIHKKECIDADKHMAYWGFLNNDETSKVKDEEDDTDDKTKNDDTSKLSKQEQRAALMKSLEARLSLRRRRALKRAAAAEAVRRARLAREARGQGKGPAKGKGAEKEETCCVCQCEFTVRGDSGEGLCCPSSHHMCSECTGVYVKSILGDLEASYPPKCPMCRGEMPTNHFESQLNTKQQTHVRAFAAQRALKPDQCLAKCPQCEHFEVQRAPGDCLWWCGSCGEGTCFVCNASLPASIQKYDIDHSPHALCKKLRFVKAKVDAAIEEGGRMECPSCGLAGRKDDACTHMTCPRCTTTWCYICGLSVHECDKVAPRPGRPVDDIFLHNQDWEVNEKRCPMYMTQILEVDLHWLGDDWENRASDEDFDDDDKCLDFFHRFKTIKALQAVCDDVGPENFVECFNHFDAAKNSGYTVDEIINTDTDKLIDRTEYLQYREEEEREEENDAPAVMAGMRVPADVTEDDLFGNFGQALLMAAEGNQMRAAIEASEASAAEDAQLRMAIDDSRGEAGRR